jgi:hypothetical protein
MGFNLAFKGLRTRKDTENWQNKHEMALFGELALEESVDLS